MYSTGRLISHSVNCKVSKVGLTPPQALPDLSPLPSTTLTIWTLLVPTVDLRWLLYGWWRHHTWLYLYNHGGSTTGRGWYHVQWHPCFMAPWDTMLRLGGELEVSCTSASMESYHDVECLFLASYEKPVLQLWGYSTSLLTGIGMGTSHKVYCRGTRLLYGTRKRDQIPLWHTKGGEDCFMAPPKRGQIALWHHQAGEDCFMAPPKDNQESKETGCFMAPPIKAKPFDIKQYLRNQLQ